jgi:hypothetical protein
MGVFLKMHLLQVLLIALLTSCSSGPSNKNGADKNADSAEGITLCGGPQVLVNNNIALTACGIYKFPEEDGVVDRHKAVMVMNKEQVGLAAKNKNLKSFGLFYYSGAPKFIKQRIVGKFDEDRDKDHGASDSGRQHVNIITERVSTITDGHFNGANSSTYTVEYLEETGEVTSKKRITVCDNASTYSLFEKQKLSDAVAGGITKCDEPVKVEEIQ